MTSSTRIQLDPTTARTAGLLYLVIIVCGIGSEALVRGPILVPGDATSTAANLAANELSFRLSMLADVIMALSDVALGVLLYRMLAPVSRTLSMMALTFRLAQAAVLGLNLLQLHHAVALLGNDVLEPAVRDAWISSFLDAHATGYDLGLFFFGVDCLVVGVLVARSGIVPRAIGPLLCSAGVVYLVGSTVRLVAPMLMDVVAPAYVVTLVAEAGFCGWLLFARHGSQGSTVPVSRPLAA